MPTTPSPAARRPARWAALTLLALAGCTASVDAGDRGQPAPEHSAPVPAGTATTTPTITPTTTPTTTPLDVTTATPPHVTVTIARIEQFDADMQAAIGSNGGYLISHPHPNDPSVSCERAYDPTSMTFALHCPAVGDEPAVGVLGTNLPPSGIESRTRELRYTGAPPSVESWFMAARANGDTTADGTVLSFVLPALPGDEHDTEFEVTADPDGTVRSITESGDPSWSLVSTNTVEQLNETFAAAVARIAAASAEWTEIDYGFRETTSAELNDVVEYAPVLPPERLGGFERTSLMYADEHLLAGNPNNPTSRQIVTATYSDGADTVTVTNRLLGATYSVDPDGITATAADWFDPFGFGTKVQLPSIELTESPAPGFAPVTAVFTMTNYTWGAVGDAMVTIEGETSADVLAAFASALR